MRPLGLHLGMGKKSGGDTPAYWGLCFTAEEDGSVVAMEKVGAAPAISLETSFDGKTWEPFYVGETSITINKGERVYFKAGEGGNKALGASTSQYNRFTLQTGKIAASGNVMSLLNGSERIDTITASLCFNNLFLGCTSLTTAPELPATTLAANCYYRMFYSCTSLTTAPELPATTLAAYCYNQMFSGCRKLNEIDVAFTAFGYMSNWVLGVSSTGTFYCPTALGTNETIARGTSYCPEGWTVINTD